MNPECPKKRGFLDFLNAFNFTVHEDSPEEHTVAVDPEMLGHIFENLLEEMKDGKYKVKLTLGSVKFVISESCYGEGNKNFVN